MKKPDAAAAHVRLFIQLHRDGSACVRSISRADDGYLVELDDRTYESDQVVVATGPFNLGSGDSMDVTLTSDERMLSLLPSTGQ